MPGFYPAVLSHVGASESPVLPLTRTNQHVPTLWGESNPFWSAVVRTPLVLASDGQMRPKGGE